MKTTNTTLALLVAIIALAFSSCKKEEVFTPEIEYVDQASQGLILGLNYDNTSKDLTINNFIGKDNVTNGVAKKLTVSYLDNQNRVVVVKTLNNVVFTSYEGAIKYKNVLVYKLGLKLDDFNQAFALGATTVTVQLEKMDGTLLNKTFNSLTDAGMKFN